MDSPDPDNVDQVRAAARLGLAALVVPAIDRLAKIIETGSDEDAAQAGRVRDDLLDRLRRTDPQP